MQHIIYVHDAATVMIPVCCVFTYVANVNILQRPADIIRRKRPFALWFPYTTVEQLLYQLEELIRMGHMVDHCDKLKKMLHGSLLNHLKMLKVDSDDTISATS
ncbi:nuclear pore complex protein Nup160-like [Trifolium medium]|uniref:Nuclear pore complex protein Nup160-like n=1 Tax=Trifolium medium TaxID=97028 RepID=A0A392P8R8_9FABA|nr:nuclear pore complex protein Nup160-like [Trifolium medium]